MLVIRRHDLIGFDNFIIDLNKLPYRPIRIEQIITNEDNTIAAVCYFIRFNRFEG